MINELESLRVLRHPNIIKFYEVFENLNGVFIVMEYGNGSNLENMLETHENISEYNIKIFMTELFQALEYCYKLKIIHGDINPSNIIIQYFTRNMIFLK